MDRSLAFLDTGLSRPDPGEARLAHECWRRCIDIAELVNRGARVCELVKVEIGERVHR